MWTGDKEEFASIKFSESPKYHGNSIKKQIIIIIATKFRESFTKYLGPNHIVVIGL